MTAIRSTTPPNFRNQRWRRLGPSAVVCLACSFGCSVYDSSLLSRESGISLSEGGTAEAPPDDDSDSGAPSANGGEPGDESGGSTSSAGEGAAEAGATGGGSDPVDESTPTAGGTGGSSVSVSYGGGGGTVETTSADGGKAASSGGAGAGGSAGKTSVGSAGSTGTAGSAGAAPTVVELAKGKKVTASSVETGNEAAKGNDNDETTRWCSIDKTLPQWWRVDLGATHRVNQVVTHFEHPDRKYTYTIETSLNDSVYTQQAIVNGTGSIQSVDLPSNVSARYVRLTVTATTTGMSSNGTVYPTWASFFEISVNGF